MSATARCSTGGGTRDLWAVTCFFNPAGYSRRIQNYCAFRQRLTVPLVTVELSFDGRFQLQPRDADVLVQLAGGDVMWQKERLLNVALKSVPGDCDRIAWVDCDVVFDSDDWAERASRALHDLVLVHLFQERSDLPPDALLDQRCPQHAILKGPSMVHMIATGEARPDDLTNPGFRPEKPWPCGLAWASRRDVLEQHGIYDAYILGGGDRALLCAALGQFDQAARAVGMRGRRRDHYLAWARPYFDSVRGRVGHIQGRLFHLWHGDLRHRMYTDRHRHLQDYDFDPFRDIAVDGNGCWRWSSDKPQLHEFVKRYFALRKEDGNEPQRTA
jgi:hypothetical protein